MTKKKQYEKPTLISLNRHQKGLGEDCSVTGSGADGNCAANGNIATDDCYSGEVARACDDAGSDPGY